MRQERTSLIRAVSGALPATSLLLLATLGTLPAVSAIAAEIPCRESTSAALDIPEESFRVRIVDLARDVADGAAPNDANPALEAQELRDDLSDVAPDLSSRARSLSILREIFNEPLDSDVLDEMIGDVGGNMTTMPEVAGGPSALAPGGDRSTGNDSAPRQPAADISAGESVVAPADDGGTSRGEARLPGVSDEEAQRYRRQMYRTDI